VPLVVVTSRTPGSGKTAVAAAIARHYAYEGRPVRLVRVRSEADGSNAAADAAFFGSLAFAPGSASVPGDWAAANAHDPGITVLEADFPEAFPDGAKVVAVRRSGVEEAAIDGAVVTVTTFAPSAAAPGGDGAVSIPEDRTLAGFSVTELRAALNAEVLVEGDDIGTTCDNLVIAPIASDAGQPYFRRFGTQAVVVRFDKTDMHLAAMQADPVCLVLTGGRQPSGYLFDAASAKGVPVLLSTTDTENTVIALEGIFDRTRFAGERKLDRLAEVLEATTIFETLAR